MLEEENKYLGIFSELKCFRKKKELIKEVKEFSKRGEICVQNSDVNGSKIQGGPIRSI
jgi:hypothetical protein